MGMKSSDYPDWFKDDIAIGREHVQAQSWLRWSARHACSRISLIFLRIERRLDKYPPLRANKYRNEDGSLKVIDAS
jgi:hypothetical protein